MLIDDIAALLAARGYGVLDTDLHGAHEPAFVKGGAGANCVTVYDTGGFAPERGLADIEERTAQIRVRNVGYAAGHAKVWGIYGLFRPPLIITVNGRRMTISPMQPPGAPIIRTPDYCIWTLNLRVSTTSD